MTLMFDYGFKGHPVWVQIVDYLTQKKKSVKPLAPMASSQTKRTRHLSFPPVVSGNPGVYSLSLMPRTGFSIGFPIKNVGNDRAGKETRPTPRHSRRSPITNVGDRLKRESRERHERNRHHPRLRRMRRLSACLSARAQTGKPAQAEKEIP